MHTRRVDKKENLTPGEERVIGKSGVYAICCRCLNVSISSLVLWVVWRVQPQGYVLCHPPLQE
jgi:hypothetical protein